MSTRSTIAIDNLDGTCVQVYCHSDGYPSHNGRILLAHVNSDEQAAALVGLGDMGHLNEDGTGRHYGKEGVESGGEPWSNVKPASVGIDDVGIDGTSYTYLWSSGRWLMDGDVLIAFDTIERDTEYDSRKLRIIARLVASEGGADGTLREIGQVIASEKGDV